MNMFKTNHLKQNKITLLTIIDNTNNKQKNNIYKSWFIIA